MRRRLFIIASALFLLVLVATLSLWVEPGTLFEFSRGGTQWEIVSGDGRLAMDNAPQVEADNLKRHAALVSHAEQLFLMSTLDESHEPDIEVQREAERVAFRKIESSPRTWLQSYSVPYWAMALFLLMVPPLSWAIAAWRARKLWVRGICPICGYDVRASNQRCPECGTLVVSAAV